MANAPRRWLVVGSGAIAACHIKCVSQLLDDVSFARLSSSGRSATSPAIDDMVDEVFESWDTALDWNPDAGIVANATSGHITALQELLTFGVPVFVEKPLARSPHEAGRIVELAKRSGQPVLVGYCLRFHPAVKRLTDLVVGGGLGSPVQCTAIVGQHIEDWRTQAPESTVSLSAQLGGGALLELSHEIDLALTLMGQVLKTEGFTSTPSRYEVDVAASLSMLHEQAVSSVSMNMLQRPAQRTFTVVATEGTVSADLITGEIAISGPDGQTTHESVEPASVMYLEQMRHFIGCATGDEHPVSDLWSAIAVLECIESVRRSTAVPQE